MKRGKIDQAQGAQEKPAGNKAIRGALLRITKPANDGDRTPVHRWRLLYKEGFSSIFNYDGLMIFPAAGPHAPSRNRRRKDRDSSDNDCAQPTRRSAARGNGSRAQAESRRPVSNQEAQDQ